MKKVLLLLTTVVSLNATAQVSLGGFPWSMARTEAAQRPNYTVKQFSTPDFETTLAEDEINDSKPIAYRTGIQVPEEVSININNTGTVNYLADGSAVWKVQIYVPNAKALSILYDNFNLPEGVTYFVTNENRKQVIGGFNHLSNNDDNILGHEVLQGERALIEFNIQPDVDLNQIQFNIGNVYAHYRGLDYLNEDFGDENLSSVVRPMNDEIREGTADACHINATCPEAKPWEILQNTVAKIERTVGGYSSWCTGNLINNTNLDCRPLFITASHCEQTNAMDNAAFNQWKFYFNFKRENCNNKPPTNGLHIKTGANFVARSPLLDLGNADRERDNFNMDGDFLLLELKDLSGQLEDFGAYLAGWDRSTNQGSETSWISFHHPQGTYMKFSEFDECKSNGYWPPKSSNGSHWSTRLSQGGSEGGSSGHLLFQANTGRGIGVLSGRVGISSGACDKDGEAYRIMFSKISHGWNYERGDGSDQQKLAPHLDPAGTGAMSLDMSKITGIKGQNCGTTPFEKGTATSDIQLKDDEVVLFPNPAKDKVSIKFNLSNATDIKIKVIDVLGSVKEVYDLRNVFTNEYNLNLSNYTSGIYLFQISTGDNNVITKKLILQ